MNVYVFVFVQDAHCLIAVDKYFS